MLQTKAKSLAASASLIASATPAGAAEVIAGPKVERTSQIWLACDLVFSLDGSQVDRSVVTYRIDQKEHTMRRWDERSKVLQEGGYSISISEDSFSTQYDASFGSVEMQISRISGEFRMTNIRTSGSIYTERGTCRRIDPPSRPERVF
jgi:hypothetical protein